MASGRDVANLDRRRLLKGGGALGLVIGMQWLSATNAPGATDVKLNAWVRIGSDDTVTILLSQSEIGQGISTTLPAILADELGADWDRVRIENSPVGPDYQNPRIHWMFTGNSESIQTFASVMRRAGAAAREMLVMTAAARWKVPPSLCRTESGRVVHDVSGRSISFGELAEAAGKQAVPDNPKLKADADLRLVGKALPRRDIPSKTDGSAIFGIDVKVPRMVYAAVRHVPTFGGSLASWDAETVMKRPGVLAVLPVPNGVAVVAERYWDAKTALDALPVRFAEGSNASLSSSTLDRESDIILEGSVWNTISSQGDPATVMASTPDPLVREYRSPFQAHATMEPMNCTAFVSKDACEIWVPTQGQELTRIVASAVSGLPPEKVRVNWTLSGGGFGRRLLADFVAEAVVLSKALGRPVKVIWTREEDMAHDFYRPTTTTRITVAVRDGVPVALSAKLVSATQLQPVSPGKLPPHVDPRVTEGLEGSRYAIANWRLDYHRPEIAIPTSVLRTTGFGPNIFALESFIDEIAHALSTDPYVFRRKLLADDKRALAVLDLAAQKADWSQPLAKGRGRGIAFCEGFETLIAQVVELSVEADKSIRLHRLITVADPGKVYDPGIGAANLECGAIFGLSSAFKSEITFKDGRTVQQNFDGYELLHLWETPPTVETYLLAGGGDKIGGLGEVGPVAVPPAVANALFAASGERVRSLPLSRNGFTIAMSA